MKNNRLASTRSLGYSMIEVMLALVILAAGVAGVYMMLKPAGINAGVQQEQKQLDSLVSGVQSAFGTTGGSYENLSVATARNLQLTGVEFNGNSLVSALGDSVALQPATVRQDHDAFDAVYTGLDERKCLAYINAFSPQTYTILVGSSQTPVQTTSGVNEGRLVSEDQIVQACNASAFKNSQGQVAFRFFSPSAQSSSVVENVCSCSPRTQERKLSCGTGQAGDITQERASTCTGGTGSCPTEVWGSWATTSNTCAGGLTPVVTPPSTPGTELCVPTTERRTQACQVGYNGSIIEERVSTCASPASNPVWGAWAVTDNSCVPNTGETYTCTPSVENRNVACPAPLMGSIAQLRSSTCSHPNASPTWGAWIEQSQNCQQACVAGQNCCQPQPDQFRDVSCASGQFGLLHEQRDSFCSGATSPLSWNSWYNIGGACQACPGPLTETDIPNWDPRSAPCPAGFAGSHTWEAQQTRTRVRTYNCNPAPLVLPPPSYTAWTTWSDTGVIRNEVNTCVSTSCTIPAGTTRTWTVGSNTCNGPALTGPVTIASGTSRAWNDLVAPTTGTASFQCNNAVLSVTPNPGATCNAPSTCPVGQVRQDVPRWFAGLEGFQDSLCNGSMMFPPFSGAYPSWPDGFPATHFEGEECTLGKQGQNRSSQDYCYDNGGSAVRVNASCSMASICVVAPCTAPAPTNTPVTRPATANTRNLTCHSVHGGTAANWTGGITQSQSRTENGTTTTTWTCPGPTSSVATAWHGTYNLGSWVTTSDTCTPVSTPTCNAGNEHHSFGPSGEQWYSHFDHRFNSMGFVCNASTQGKYVFVGQNGPVGTLGGFLYRCHNGAFNFVFESIYGGGPGFADPPVNLVSPLSNATGLYSWSDIPGHLKGVEVVWFATWVCEGTAPPAPTQQIRATGYFGGAGSWWGDALEASVDVFTPGSFSAGPVRHFLGACPSGYPATSSYNLYDVCVAGTWPPSGSASCTIPAGRTFSWSNSDSATGSVSNCSGTVPATTTIAHGATINVNGTPSTNRGTFMCVNGKVVVWPTWNNCM